MIAWCPAAPSLTRLDRGCPPPVFESKRPFPCASQGKLLHAIPSDVKKELQSDPGSLLKNPDGIAAKLSEAQQAEAGTAVQDMLLGALQFALTSPQQAADKMSALLQSLPRQFTDIVTTANSKLQKEATDVVSSLPKETVSDMQGLIGSLAPALMALGGGASSAPYPSAAYPAAAYPAYSQPAYNYNPAAYAAAGYGQMPGYAYPSYGFPAAVGTDGSAMPQAMAQAGGLQQSPQQQYNAQLQAMQYYYMQQMQYMQAQMNYIQQLQAASNVAGGAHPAAPAAAAA